MDNHLDPHILPIYFQYERLTARTLGQFLTELGRIADFAGEKYSKQFGLSVRMPSLEIDTAQTGDSINFKFGEGWLPSISMDKNHDIVINTLKKLGIPLLVGYLIISAAEKILNLQTSYLDNRIKKIELKLKEQELNKIMGEDHEEIQQLLSQAGNLLKTLMHDEDIKVFQVYDIKIIDIQNKKGRKSHKE